MKKITKILLATTLLLSAISCGPTAKSWHYSSARIGAQSIYIDKKGEVSVSQRVGDKFLIKYFDSNGTEIKNMEEEIKLDYDPYKRPNALKNQIMIGDPSDTRKDYSKYIRMLNNK